MSFIECPEGKTLLMTKLLFWDVTDLTPSTISQKTLNIITSRFNTKAMQSNALAAVQTALCCDIPEQKIERALENIKPLPLRLEVLDGGHQSILLNDTWSNDRWKV